ncbi:MAG TPA: BTAD domain-containing putative transcriptional regulator, partial [Thermomicrobiales bacterium]|nr:BTAD domain-containing putative transcriptional regulator [Thermomicrobiales bacterium]
MESRLRIEMLGGFRVYIDGHAVSDAAWTLSRVRVLLKLLALAPAPGHQLHRDVLMDTLWPNLDPAAAANNLHKVVHLARRGLTEAGGAQAASWLRVANGAVALVPPAGLTTDVGAFEGNAARARLAPTRAALEHAIASYTGDLLPDDLYADWAANRRHLLRETWLTLLADLTQVQLAAGDVAAGITTLERQLAADPLRETAQRALMCAYSDAGEPGRALRAYEQFRDLLRRDLDASPDPATTNIYARLLTVEQTPASLPQPLATHAGQLDHDLTSLLGREDALDELRQLLGTARLVSLVGPGGVGKTRLAREAARDAGPAARTWFVDLAAVADGRRVPHAIASALRLRHDPARDDLDLVIDALSRANALLILDNCEHLIDACATTVDRLLRACPAARLLVTSREPLGVAGEVTVPVGPLALPDRRQDIAVEDLALVPSVALFCERALAAQPAFRLTSVTAPDVVTICSMLEGLPLAIELAAVRLRTMTAGQIAAQLGNALDLLTRGPRTAPPRQRSLRATLDWSYRLLDAGERAVLRAVAIFSGSWSVAAADAVADRPDGRSTFELLTSLAEKSLIVPTGTAVDVRYRMLEPVRQWALQLLNEAGERDAVQHRQRAWYVLQVTQRAEPFLWQGGRLDWIGDELGNLRVALESTVRNREAIGDGVRLARAIYSFSEEQGWLEFGLNDEARGWLNRLLGDPESDHVPG